MYSLVLVKRYELSINGIVIVVSVRVDKIRLKLVDSDRNM
jgi:hypothetical protein